ncbi:substrate-binding domain-containing protein, partial [Streptomyces cyaneofuscatus]
MAGLATGCADGKSASGGGGLRASGSTTVAPVAADAAEALKAEGMNITIATQGGSAGGISQLAAGQIDIALSSKPIAEEDRTAHPKADFVTTQIGSDAVGVIVTKPVADAGVKNLTVDQVLAELARLHRELPDVSILYVTHDQVEALTLA